ncbi:beta-N-acetylhexosaminidase [Flavobacterium sp. W1B]|uniref:beta-N-acetylhexosaminidase n=1 Tax=Flavobacterium sp. W1B TaxID=3394146 RepID=UPI0039BD0182
MRLSFTKTALLFLLFGMTVKGFSKNIAFVCFHEKSEVLPTLNKIKLNGYFNEVTLGDTLVERFSNDKNRTVNIIPEPVSMQISEGRYIIDRAASIYFNSKDAELSKHAGFLSTAIESLSGIKLKKAVSANKAAIQLVISKSDVIGKEGYNLRVTEKGIVISANTDKGIFYGIQTLLQIMPAIRTNQKLQIPRLAITDYPRFQWRGMMLDVSRHFFSPEAIKNYIDLLASYKMNVFHWHLADAEGWRLEIKKYPKLTSVGAWRQEMPGSIFYKKEQKLTGEPFSYGGYYTQEQVKEIIAYAVKRNVTVVPEIEMPGHSDAAIAAYPEFGCTGKPQGVRTSMGPFPGAEANFCAGKESTFLFLQDVLQEVIQLFPSSYIHVGGDEVDKKCWENCSLCQKRMKTEGLKDVKELQSYFIKRIGKFLTAKGRKMIGWDEILEGGLAPNATVMSWRGEKGGIDAAKLQHDVIMTPAKVLYFNRYQADTLKVQQRLAAKFSINSLKKVYDYEPVPKELNADEARFVLGAQACLWTEFISSVPHLEQMTMPRMLALSEVLWSPLAQKNWNQFKEKVPVHTNRLGIGGIGFFFSEFLTIE